MHNKKKKSKDSHWSNFSQDLSATMPIGTAEKSCKTNFLGTGLGNLSLQEKYQQSNYYNGFEVFQATNNSSQMPTSSGRASNSGSLFDSDLHHNCEDDSPPPTITGFNSYLEGISNTGVIRYDDASFLKNLIPGQNLNNEISIHNINDANFTRSTTSPVAHRVEITPVYSNRPTSTNIYEHCSSSRLQPEQQPNFVATSSTSYHENLPDYGNGSNIFASNNLLNLNEIESGEQDFETFKPFAYDFEAQSEKQKMIDLNDLLVKKNVLSQRSSPYLDETTLDKFVQNMNSLKIKNPEDEQCSQLSCRSKSEDDANSSSNATSNTANGWW